MLFFGVNGKYLAGEVNLCPLGDTVTLSSVSFTSHPFFQQTLACADPRGPPTA